MTCQPAVAVPPIEITDARLFSSNVAENDHAEYDETTTYAKDDYVIVTDTDIHRIYQSSEASNLGNYPPDNLLKWVDRGATNCWRMFDETISTQTENADSIVIEIDPGARADFVSLHRVSAATARIEVTSGVTTLHDETYDMIDHSAITGMYSFFFGARRDKKTLTENIPPHSTARIKITLTKTGGTAKCGHVAIGKSIKLGDLMFGWSAGIKSYAKKTEKDDGSIIVTPGRTAKIGNFPIKVDNNNIVNLIDMLGEYHSTPITWIFSNQYDVQTVFGFYESLEEVINHSAFAECNLRINGIV